MAPNQNSTVRGGGGGGGGEQQQRPLSPTFSQSSMISGGARSPVGLVNGNNNNNNRGFDANAEVAERLGHRILSIILGNLFTLMVLAVMYLNYVLFESYMGVFLYAFLASEALWDTKRAMVEWIQHMNSRNHGISPRAVLLRWISAVGSFNGLGVWTSLGLYSVALAVYPYEIVMLSLGCLTCGLVTYILDDHVLIVFRLHRLVLDDDTLVATVLIVFLMVAGLFIVSVFVLLSVRDASKALNLMFIWLEKNLFSSDWVEELFREVSGSGRESIQEWVNNLETMYLQNSTWAPAIRWAVKYAEEFSTSFDENVSYPQPQSSWVSPNFHDFLLQEDEETYRWWWPSGLGEWNRTKFQELAREWFSSNAKSDSSNLEDISSSLKETFFTVLAMVFSFGFLIVDFGVRITFFVTILFILLSSRETVLHEVLAGFMSTEDRANSALANFEIQLRATIEAVLMLPIKMSMLNALTTMLLFWLFQMELLFFASSLSLLITVFPIISPFWLPLPWIVVYYFNSRWNIGWCVFVFTVNYTLFYYANLVIMAGFGKRIQSKGKQSTFEYDDTEDSLFESFSSSAEESPSSTVEKREEDVRNDEAFADRFNGNLLFSLLNAVYKAFTSEFGKQDYITGVSVFFGVTAFGAQGVLVGPLLVALALVLYNVFLEQQQSMLHPSNQPLSPYSFDEGFCSDSNSELNMASSIGSRRHSSFVQNSRKMNSSSASPVPSPQRLGRPPRKSLKLMRNDEEEDTFSPSDSEEEDGYFLRKPRMKTHKHRRNGERQTRVLKMRRHKSSGSAQETGRTIFDIINRNFTAAAQVAVAGAGAIHSTSSSDSSLQLRQRLALFKQLQAEQLISAEEYNSLKRTLLEQYLAGSLTSKQAKTGLHRSQSYFENMST